MSDRAAPQGGDPPRPPWASGDTEPLPIVGAQPAGDPGTPASDLSSLASNALIVASAFVASRVLGMVREMVIAARFGTSAEYDAYVAAFRIPDLLFLVVMSGAFGSAFIPVFAGFLGRDEREKAWRLASVMLSYTLVALALTSAVTILLAGPLVDHLIAPGLDDQQTDLATSLTRYLLLSPLLLGLGAAFKGMLEAQERFALSAYAPVFYNLAIIAGAAVLAPSMGIYGLATGVVAGALLHAGVQAAGLWRGGMRLRFTLDRGAEGVGLVGRLMAPRILGQAAFQVNFIVMTNFASREGASAVGALNYAFQLLMLPYGVLALSLSTVIFPMLSRQFDQGRFDAMRATLARAVAPLVFLTLPASVGLVAFRTSLVQVLFQFGAFDARSTQLVAEALGYFALALLGLSVVEAITRVFYAMQDTRTPVAAAIATIAVNIALSAILAPRLGHGGLALSFALTSTAEMAILVAVLRRRLPGWFDGLHGSLVRSAAAVLLFLPIALWMGGLLADVTDPHHGRGLFGYLLFGYGLATAAMVYIALAWLLGVRELAEIAGRVPLIGRRLQPLLAWRYRSAGR